MSDSPDTPSPTFTCYSCHKTYSKAKTDIEAIEEALKIWGQIEDPAILCDACYHKLMKEIM